jgi:hypothetical protein
MSLYRVPTFGDEQLNPSLVLLFRNTYYPESGFFKYNHYTSIT